MHFECVLRETLSLLLSLLEVQESLQGVQSPIRTRDAMTGISMKPGKDRREGEKISGSNTHFGLLKNKKKRKKIVMGFMDLAAWGSVEPGKCGHHKSVSQQRGASCVYLDTNVQGMCVQGLVHVHTSDLS